MKDQIPKIDVSEEQKTENKKTEEEKKKIFYTAGIFGGFTDWFGHYSIAILIGFVIAFFIIILPASPTEPTNPPTQSTIASPPPPTEPTKLLPGMFYKPDGSLDTVLVTVLAVAGVVFFTGSGRRRW